MSDEALIEKWLSQCGPCDGGLPMGCACPDEDYRPTMSALLDRAQAAEAILSRLRELADEGYYLSRPYGEKCETCCTQWQESGIALRGVIGDPS